MEIVYLNGAYLSAEQARVPVFDRGFLFGDSVYEVIPFYQGKGFRLKAHLQRLNYSLQAVGIEAQQDWEMILAELVARNGGGNLSAYLQVTRGSTGRRTHAITPELSPTVFACCQPIAGVQDSVQTPSGISARVVEDIRWQRCDIKATGLLPNILALQEARAGSAQEALFCRNGLMTEGASSNLFIVEAGCLITPELSHGVLGGTTRALILELARHNNLSCCEEEISYNRLLAADEVWISSSTRGVVPVIEIDRQRVSNGQKGPLWHTMFTLYKGYQQKLMAGEIDD